MARCEFAGPAAQADMRCQGWPLHPWETEKCGKLPFLYGLTGFCQIITLHYMGIAGSYPYSCFYGNNRKTIKSEHTSAVCSCYGFARLQRVFLNQNMYPQELQARLTGMLAVRCYMVFNGIFRSVLRFPVLLVLQDPDHTVCRWSHENAGITYKNTKTGCYLH